MESRRKSKWWIIAAVLVVLAGMGFYGYTSHQQLINNGVYSIAQVRKMRPAKIGYYRVWFEYSHDGTLYQVDGIFFFESLSLNDVGKRFFIKFLEDDPDGGVIWCPLRDVPDTLQSAPSKGWSEEWMKQNFPKVVEYVHDTR